MCQRTVPCHTDSHGRNRGEKAAHIYRNSFLSYRELVEMSDALAAYLIEEFNEDKTPVIVYGHKQHEMLVCFLACVKSGHAYISVDSSFPDERVKDIIEGSNIKMILGVDRIESPKTGIGALNIENIRDIISNYRGQVPGAEFAVSPEDNYYIYLGKHRKAQGS